MSTVARAPPVVGLALAVGAGAVAIHLGVPLPWMLLFFLLLLLPEASSSRPRPPSGGPGSGPGRGKRSVPALALPLAFLSGALLTHAWILDRAEDCRYRLRDGQAMRVEGRLTGRVVDGRGEIGVAKGGEGACAEALRFVLRDGRSRKGGVLRPGGWVILQGVWRKGRADPRFAPLWAGYLRVDSVVTGPPASRAGGRPRAPGIGGRVQERLGVLYPEKRGLAEALVLARKEGLSGEIKDAFARAGTAHLLAISGFHVGVVAGLLLLLTSLSGAPHAVRFAASSSGVWIYVLGIGAPDAAVRAALILTILAVGRILDRPVAPMGALASAFLFFFVLDAGAVLRPGFQLSFAGTAGLVLWGRPIGRVLRRRLGGPLSLPLCAGLAAGISATAATLPLVAWHFERVSLVGIPTTLVATPLVALAIPGIFASLLTSFLLPPVGRFLARGVEGILEIIEALVTGVAELPLASVWVSRPTVVAAFVGIATGFVLLRVMPLLPSRARGSARGLPGPPVLALTVLFALGLAPVASGLLARGSMEIVVLDVGQGDALAIRSPANRWLVVDAGPRTETFDAGGRVVLPYLRRRGVRKLEALLLTHPDMDHVGGAAALVEGIPLDGMGDPGHAAGKEVYLRVLEAAEGRAIPWRVLRAGDSLDLDGIALRVVAPAPDATPPSGLAGDPNASSLVLELRFGAFTALLTGDAPAREEEAVLPRLLSARAQVLKVGHHGSRTSTSPELLERVRPRVALVSVGRRNRYGHPHRTVLEALDGAGVEVRRTDLEGTLVVRARRDGSYRVWGERGG